MRYEKYEKEHWDLMQEAVNVANLGLPDIVKNFSAFIRRRELSKLLAHYELFKKVADLPGSICELGVYLGGGLFTWAKLLETFLPGDRGRKVYGFESFRGYENFTERDGNAEPWVTRLIGDLTPNQKYMELMVNLHNNDNFLRGVERVKVIPGDICETTAQFARDSLGTRFSLLYFDVNLYEPTLAGLKNLYPLVVPGGIIAFNAYGSPPWEGEANAIEEYFNSINLAHPVMRKMEFSMYPNAYFIKQ